MKFIPYGRQEILEEDIRAVTDALTSDFITQGPRIEQFEKDLCEYAGAQFATVSTNGTTALHLACLALGVGPGDWVWTTPISFVASSNCALYCGASVDFVDIDPQTYNICPDTLEEKLRQAAHENRLPKVIIPVHLCGLSCEMQRIHELAQQYGIKIIEDACHAIGGTFLDKKVGSCQFSDITVYSFHPVKNLTTGEGGACLTNSAEYQEKMLLLRSHGITRDPQKMTQASDGPWYYQQINLGFNYRITDIQAALGSSQLKRLDSNIQKRRKIAKQYRKELADFPLQMPAESDKALSAYHLFVVRVQNQKRNELFKFLREVGIGVNVHYIPIPTQPFYQSMTLANGPFPKAQAYYEEAISLPMFPTLTQEEFAYICESIKKFFS